MSALRAMRGNNSHYSLLPRPLNPRPRVGVRNSTQRLRARAPRRRKSARRPHQREIGEKWETPQSGAASLHERSLQLTARPLGGNDRVCSSSTTANNHQHLILGLAWIPVYSLTKKNKKKNGLAVWLTWKHKYTDTQQVKRTLGCKKKNTPKTTCYKAIHTYATAVEVHLVCSFGSGR